MLEAPSPTPVLDNPLANLHELVLKFMEESFEDREAQHTAAKANMPKKPRITREPGNKEIASYTKVEPLSGCSQASCLC